MEKIKELLEECLNIDFISAVLSNPREKSGAKKVKVRPVLKKEQFLFQCEEHRNNQVFHENCKPEHAVEVLCGYMEQFRQMQIETKQMKCTVLVSKKGKVTIQKKQQTSCVKEVNLSHNRNKRYILEEGIAVPGRGSVHGQAEYHYRYKRYEPHHKMERLCGQNSTSFVRSIVFWNL